MRSRVRTFDVFTLCGAIFASVGSFFLVAGVWMFLNFDYVVANGEGDARMLPPMFAGMGGLFVVLGVALLARGVRRRMRVRRLVAVGRFVMADCVELVTDWSVRVNRRPGVRARCVWFDPFDGKGYEFVGDPMFGYVPVAVGDLVRVYVDVRENPDFYYVDV